MGQNKVIVISGASDIIVDKTCEGSVVVTQGTVVQISTGETNSLVSPFVAGEPISTYQVVAAFGNSVFPATVTNPAHIGNVIGIAISSANTGETVNVVTHGRVTNPAWSWDDTLPAYLSDVIGGIIQDDVDPGVNGATFSLRIGTVRDADTIDVNIRHDIVY